MFHVSLSWTHEDCFNVILGVTFFHQSRKSRVRCLACCFPPPRYWKVTRLSELVLQWWFKYLEDSPWSSISFWYWQPLGRTHFVGKTRKCGTTFFFSLFLIFNFFFDVSTTRCMSLRKRLLKKAFFVFFLRFGNIFFQASWFVIVVQSARNPLEIWEDFWKELGFL